MEGISVSNNIFLIVRKKYTKSKPLFISIFVISSNKAYLDNESNNTIRFYRKDINLI